MLAVTLQPRELEESPGVAPGFAQCHCAMLLLRHDPTLEPACRVALRSRTYQVRVLLLNDTGTWSLLTNLHRPLRITSAVRRYLRLGGVQIGDPPRTRTG